MMTLNIGGDGPQISAESDIYVDPQLCIGCGACVAIASDFFAMNSDSVAAASGVLSDDNLAMVAMALQACPVQAIILRD